MKGETTCSSAVEVVVRVRPLQPALKESATAWSWTSSAPSTEAPHTSANVITELANRDARFTFDAVFPPESSTELLYVQRIRHDVVRRTAQGYNGTVLAYGQTGSGKTYTMFGSHSTAEVRGSSPPSSSAGLIDLALTDLFAALAEEKSTDQHLRSVRVDVSIVELYNEHLRDLLATEATSPLSIREHAQGTYVHNAVRIQVGDLFGCLDLIHQHAAQRVCGATAMNENSSRSHCIAQVRVEREYDDRATNNNNNNNNTHLDEKQTLVVEHAQPTRVVCSSLTFVDLAGSERVSKSAAVGQRMVEGGHINKSLTSLAMVIQRVVEQQQQQQRVGSTAFVPYRDSKLTHLLKSSLGGNAYTCIVCCISPSMESVAESRGTLQFAARAKRVENRAIINERLSHAAEVRGLELALKHVREQLVVNRIFLWSKEAKVKRLGAQVDHLASLWSSHVCGEAGSATAPSERSRADVLVRLRYLEEENTLLRQELHSSANSTITTKTGQTSSHNRVLEDLRTEVLELGKMVERVEGERDEVQHSLTELESITQELEEESLKWEARAGQLTTCNATLTEQVEELIHGKEALRREVDLLRAQIAERWTSLPKDGAGVVEHLRAALHDEEGAHAEACRVASEDKHMMQRQMKALQNECDAIKVERDRMIADAAGLREDLRRMMHATSELLGIVEEPSKMDAATDDDGVQGRIIALQRLVRRLRAAHPANDGASMIASLRSPTTHRDLIVDAKLKRMQDLVLRLHTTNTLISQELSSHHRDKMLLLDLVKELDASAESVAMERGVLRLQPLDALLAKVRYTAETQRPGKPMGHN